MKVTEFVNGVKIYQIKTKDSKLNAYPLCFGNIWKVFIVNNTRKLDYVDDLSADYDSTGDDDILDIHEYLIKNWNLLDYEASAQQEIFLNH